MTNTIKLPSYNSANFHAELIEFGYFLERKVRPNCKHDLNTYPNTVWNAIQSKMLDGLKHFIETKVSSDEVLMLQWYNSGVFIKTADKVLGFDILY